MQFHVLWAWILNRACKMLGIKDLHFHDLRHEATSRLFERGFSIVQAQQITLHCKRATLPPTHYLHRSTIFYPL